MITQTLRPFRNYNEKDVVNLFTLTGTPIDTTYLILATKGTLVKIVGDGFRNDVQPDQIIGNAGQFSVNNFQALRYGTTAQCAVASQANGDVPIGMTLFDVRELDENLEFLKYRPQKAAEMEAVLSGQTVPIVTRGTFLYSGIQISTGVSGVLIPVVAGNPCYLGFSGGISTSGTAVVGTFYSTTGTSGAFANNTNIALVKLNIS